MNGLDVNIRNTRDFVQEIDIIHVAFTALFTHPHAQHVIFNTNFIEYVAPKIKSTIEQCYDEYYMHVLVNNTSSSSHSTPATSAATTTTTADTPVQESSPSSKELNELIGNSRRVVHEHHYHDQSCTVCRSSYKQNEFIRTLPLCKHVFHKRCVDPWIKRNQSPTCPICRANILPSVQTNVHPLMETVRLSDEQSIPAPVQSST